MYRHYRQIIVPRCGRCGIDPRLSQVDIDRIGEMPFTVQVSRDIEAAMDRVDDKNSHEALQAGEDPLRILYHQIGKQGVTTDRVSIEEGNAPPVQGKLSPGLTRWKTYDLRDILQDMHSFGKEQGDYHQHIDRFFPELVHRVLDGGGVHIHETAFYNKIRISPGNKSCSLFDEFLIVGEFATMTNQ